MTPDEQTAHEKFVEDYREEQEVRGDVSAFYGMAALALIPALIFGEIVSALLDLPAWSFLLLAVPVVLAPRLYALWRFDQSSLALKIAGIALPQRERRHWLIIAAVITIAGVLLSILVPQAISSVHHW